jgi:hypothetical protein
VIQIFSSVFKFIHGLFHLKQGTWQILKHFFIGEVCIGQHVVFLMKQVLSVPFFVEIQDVVQSFAFVSLMEVFVLSIRYFLLGIVNCETIDPNVVWVFITSVTG